MQTMSRLYIRKFRELRITSDFGVQIATEEPIDLLIVINCPVTNHHTYYKGGKYKILLSIQIMAKKKMLAIML